MRLSEAIREGGKMVDHQIFNRLYDSTGGACAMGAALVAAKAPLNSAFYRQAFPDLPKMSAVCPTCGLHADGDGLWQSSGAIPLVVHLNNTHQWTFDQIADYIQAQEALAGLGGEQEPKVETRELVEA